MNTHSPYTSQTAILIYLTFAVLWLVVLMQR
jgi:hypothetical protein